VSDRLVEWLVISTGILAVGALGFAIVWVARS
jgi:preprotein translocase subunit Sss1